MVLNFINKHNVHIKQRAEETQYRVLIFFGNNFLKSPGTISQSI